MASVRTYILAPNLQYRPSGPIQIGNIIADPFQPTRALSSVPVDKHTDIETVTEHHHELLREKGQSLDARIWVHFLQSIGTESNAERGAERTRAYSIDELETRYLHSEPADDDPELMRRLAEPRVQAAINAGLFGRQPVYLISGVKIAKGLSARSELRREAGGGAGTTVPVAESVSLGAEVGGKKYDNISSSYRTEESVVFAYQLHVLRLKGRKKRLTVGVFESEVAFLHEDDDEQINGVSIKLASTEDLERFEDQHIHVANHELVDAEGTTCVCVVAHAE
ncbi:hypothetical protein MANI_020363 [Metarhizium anisopliae]